MEQAVKHEHQADKRHPHQHEVEVTVNEKPVVLPDRKVTGLEIKQAAIAQGVPIQLDFVLQQELPHGQHKVIGDQDEVKLHPHDRFTAIADDDNS
jgi:hypothetical protein